MFNLKKKEPDFTAARQSTGNIITAVLLGKLHVKKALLLFPPDIEDDSVKVAWHALCHLEADEDIRRNDIVYKEEQDAYLNNLAYTLLNGEPLPSDIIAEYKLYYETTLAPHKKGLAGFFAGCKNFLTIKK